MTEGFLEMASVTRITKGLTRSSILNRENVAPEGVKIGSWRTKMNLTLQRFEGLERARVPKVRRYGISEVLDSMVRWGSREKIV